MTRLDYELFVDRDIKIMNYGSVDINDSVKKIEEHYESNMRLIP